MGPLFEALHARLSALVHWVEAFANHPQGSWVLFIIAFAESSFFPIPPDVLLIALAMGAPEKSFWFATICSVASVLGGAAGYGIGFAGGRPVLNRLFSASKVRAVHDLYDRYNAWATGIAGLTPLPYKLFTISGGAFAIDFRVFMVASVVSRSLRFFAVAGVVYLFGDAARELIDRHLEWMAIAFVILLILGFLLVERVARRIGSRGTMGRAEGTREVGRRLVVEGRVQGVSFRAFTQRTARRLGLAGWVRNREDGAVEAEASGPQEALDEFIAALRTGPPAARVTRLRVEELEDPPSWSGFEVRY